MIALILIACSSNWEAEPDSAGRGDASLLASYVAGDFVLLAKNGIDAQVFATYNSTPVDNSIGLWDSTYSSSSVNPNAYRILASVGSDGYIDVVRPYGTTGSVSIPSGGYVVSAAGTYLPFLSGLAVDDPLTIKMTTECEARPWGAIPTILWHSITDVKAFELQLDAIQKAGYTTMAQDDVAYYLDGGLDDCFYTMPDKPIFLTFDDGYDNQFANVPAMLNERDMIATFFIITSYPYDHTSTTWASWDAINAALDTYPNNVELACHSHAAHSQVSGVAKYLTMTDADAIADMELCQDKLYEKTGAVTAALAWPFGSHTAALTDDARKAGFETMWSTMPGINVFENDDASAEGRRFGVNATATWASAEVTMSMWYVCP